MKRGIAVVAVSAVLAVLLWPRVRPDGGGAGRSGTPVMDRQVGSTGVPSFDPASAPTLHPKLLSRRKALMPIRAAMREEAWGAEAARARVAARNGSLGFEGGAYDLTTESGELAFRLHDQGAALGLHLSSIHTPDAVLYDGAPATFALLGDAELAADRGCIRERLRPVAEGVEQLFDLAQDPKGDLTFELRTSGLRGPAEPCSASQITFWNGQTAAATYGKVVIVDAAGQRLPLPVAWNAPTLSFTIPAAWLATASYPVVVDPTIGSVILIVTSTDYGPYHNNDIAWNNTAGNYRSVYGHISPTGTNNDVFTNTIDPTTGAIGVEGTVIADATQTFMPSISWNPSNNRFLVTYGHSDGVNPFEVRGMVLDATGAPVGGATPFTISVNPGPLFDDYGADIACDGTNWLVVWRQDEVDSAGTTLLDVDIKARIVNGTSDNTTQSYGTGVVDVAVTANFEANPAVAFGAGGNYLIVIWDASANANLGGIFGRTMTTGGVLGALTEYDDAAVVGQIRETPDVTANTTNSEFLVGWDQYQSTTPFLGDPYVRRVSSAGAALGASPLSLDPDAAADATHVTPVWNALMNRYYVGWGNDEGPTDANFDIMGAILNGPDIAIITNNIAVATANSQLAGHSNKPFTAVANRTGTAHIIHQWRKRPAPFEINAQRFSLNNPPADPVLANLQQDQGATITTPDPAGTIYTTLPRQMTFRAGVTSDAEGHTVKLQIERILNSASYTGTFTEESALQAAGSNPTITVSPIPNGQYKWRARFVDQLGDASNWVEFDAAAGFDHELNIPNQLPGVPDVTQNATTGQFRMNGTTQIATGGLTPEGTVILKGSITADPDGDNVQLQVEVQPIGTAFTNTPNLSSTMGAAGVHQVSFTPVTSTAGYHWQARVRDSSGAPIDTTAWVSYGGNPEANIDFARDAAANTTAAPGALLQFEADGTTALALGATAGSRTVVLKATTTDPEGDQYTLEVEVKPISVAFDGTVTASSASTNSGAQASVSVTIPGFAPESYHWQVRTRDALNATSAFVVFAANGDVPPAGTDFALPQVDFGGSRNNLKCSLAAGAFGVPWLLALLALAGLARRRR